MGSRIMFQEGMDVNQALPHRELGHLALRFMIPTTEIHL